MHAKPDLRVELEPNDHFFRLGDLGRYPPRGSIIRFSMPDHQLMKWERPG